MKQVETIKQLLLEARQRDEAGRQGRIEVGLILRRLPKKDSHAIAQQAGIDLRLHECLVEMADRSRAEKLRGRS